jgi:putative aminopeptidase FrvX
MKSGEKFLEKYVNAASPSGYELALGGQNVWIEYVRRYCDDMHVGTYGNAYAYMYGNNLDVVVEAVSEAAEKEWRMLNDPEFAMRQDELKND